MAGAERANNDGSRDDASGAAGERASVPGPGFHQRPAGRRRRIIFGALAMGLVGALTVGLWPSRGARVGYPMAGIALGNAASPLWKLDPTALEKLTVDDAARLENLAAELTAALVHIDKEAALLSAALPDDLDAASRARARLLWWSLLEPLLALDELKSRYEGWYGVDYAKYPGLHARAFGLSYAALCAQLEAGNTIVSKVGGRQVIQSLFDEAMPEYGVPSGTFRNLRAKMARAKDVSLVPLGAEWFDEWIAPHLRGGKAAERIATLVASKREGARRGGSVKLAKTTMENELEILKGEAFQRWFPVQKRVAEWFGDTRVAPEGRRLISDAQLHDMQKVLAPGDIIVERRNWYLSNIGLPGFWPHAALYVGTPGELAKAFDADDAVLKRFGGPFTQHLAKRHAEAYAALERKDDRGHPHSVLEAVSEGVVVQSLEHSCGADYVAALRPSFSKVDVAAAIDKAMSFYGRPYDFNFDFATDDQIVCSELVLKAYEPSGVSAPGLRVPFITVAGRRAVPPTEFVRLFARERGTPSPQLSFVYFLDGREKTRSAVVASEDDLVKSAERPKWDIAQP